MQVEMNDSIEVAKRLKYYTSNLYKLSPIELAEFMKLKGNLHLKGVSINNEVLNTPDDILATYIQNCSNDGGDNMNLKQLLEADLDAVEEERVAIRKQLFEHDVRIRIVPTGGAFSVQWNKKLNTCRIQIPSSWTMEIDHSLLISLYDRDLSRTSIDTSNHSVNEVILQLFFELQDYALVKHRIQQDNAKVDIAPFVMSALQNAVESGKIAYGQALEWIGLHRRRLIMQFSNLQNAETLSV
jgi:hypothetical protein